MIEKKWLDDQPIENLICRDIRHEWKPCTAKITATGFEDTLECGRCETTKVRTLNKRGEVLFSKMIYPDHFVRKGCGRMTRQDNAALRLATMYRRLES